MLRIAAALVVWAFAVSACTSGGADQHLSAEKQAAFLETSTEFGLLHHVDLADDVRVRLGL